MGRFHVFLLVTALALVLKAPVALWRFRAFPDAIAYTNIARNMADGRGFTSTLKLNYFDDSPVTHCALSDWPPLYPLFAGAGMSVGLSETGLQAVNAALVALAAGLVFVLGDRLFGRRVGVISGLFAAIAPNLFRAGIVAMSDALGLALALGACLVAVSADGRKMLWFAAGALAGAAYLARFPNAVLAVAFVIWQPRRREFACAGVCAVGFAVSIAPVLVLGRATTCAQAFHFAVGSYSAAARSYGTHLGFGYAASHAPDVIAAVGRNAAFYALDLLGGLRGLSLLGAGLVVSILGRGRTVSGLKSRNTHIGLVLLVAVLNFAVYVLAWSAAPVRGSRFMLLSYCLLLPFCIAGIENGIADRRKLRGAIYAIVAGVYVVGAILASVSREYEMQPLSGALTAKVSAEVGEVGNVASNNPWVVSHSAHRPTALLPRNLSPSRLREFMRRYDITAIVVLKSTTESLTQRTLRGALQAEPVGDVTIYR